MEISLRPITGSKHSKVRGLLGIPGRHRSGRRLRTLLSGIPLRGGDFRAQISKGSDRAEDKVAAAG